MMRATNFLCQLRRLLVALALLCTGAGALADTFGRFLDPLNVRLLDDGRRMELTQEFRYEDPEKNLWTAPKGIVVDGASIPQALWSVVGGPLSGRYRSATVIHDWYCESQQRDWRSTHKVFYFAMRAGGVSEVKARGMYAAVIAFGPRWGDVRIRYSDTVCVSGECREVTKERLERSVVKLVPTEAELRQLASMLRQFNLDDNFGLRDLEDRSAALTDAKFPSELKWRR